MGVGTQVMVVYMASANGDFVAVVSEFLPSPLILCYSAGSRTPYTYRRRPLADGQGTLHSISFHLSASRF